MAIAIAENGGAATGRAIRLRRYFRLLLGFPALLCSVLAVSPAAAGSAFPVDEVAPGIFVHAGAIELMSAANRGAIANVGFIVGEEAVAIIDTGGSIAAGKALLQAVRAETHLPVRFVVNTHMHPDHVLGNQAFEPLRPVFVGAARLPAALSARGAHYIEATGALIGRPLAADARIVPPSLLVTDVMSLDLGGRRLSLRAWPVAHTDNDLTVFDEATKTLFAGDLVFLEHVPALDGSIRGWLAAIDALAAVPAERVVPGHGPAAAPWPEALAPQRRYLSTLAAEVDALIEAGATIAEAPARVAREEREKWQLFDEFHARNVIAAFAELEWE